MAHDDKKNRPFPPYQLKACCGVFEVSVSTYLRKLNPTIPNVGVTPNASADKPPIAGPSAVPALNAAMTGAIVLALLSGVLISVIANVAAVLSAATPKPVDNLKRRRWSIPIAQPIPPLPSAIRPSEYTR